MPATLRLAHKEVGAAVAALTAFQNTNGTLYGGRTPHSEDYVVWSYGPHWPLYYYSREFKRWYGNTSKNSMTTNRHRTHAYPKGVHPDDIVWLDHAQIDRLVDIGAVEFTMERLKASPQTHHAKW